MTRAFMVAGRKLCHLLERHHTERFAALMDQAQPQWRARRQELNSAPLAHERWVCRGVATRPGCQSSVNLIDGFIERPYSHPP
jgi:hypothetical protein